MDPHLRNLIEHVALKDGGCSMPIPEELITDFTRAWAMSTCSTFQALWGTPTFDQLTMAFVAGDLIIGHSTTMN